MYKSIMYKEEMLNVQIHNIQMYKGQMSNVKMHYVQNFKGMKLQKYKCNIVE